MIVLDAKGEFAPVFETLDLLSLDGGISILVEEARKKVGDEWVADPSKHKQVIRYQGTQGEMVELEGLTQDAETIAPMAAAKRVRVEVAFYTIRQAASKIGGYSRESVGLRLVRITGVWDKAGKLIHASKNANVKVE